MRSNLFHVIKIAEIIATPWTRLYLLSSDQRRYFCSAMAALDSSSTHEVETTNLATLLAQAHSSLFFSSTVITVILPILGIISWLAVTGTKDAFSTIERFSAASVSGSMSQSTTKLIDFIYSAILVPLFMVILDYIWFSIARVSSVNKTDSSLRLGIPLKSLVAISRASYGTYNPTLLSDLNKGRSGKLRILIALLLLSALANSTLSNIIAYEAFSEKVLSSLGEAGILRYLSDDIITTWFKRPSALQATLGDHGFQFDIDQQTALASQLTAILTGPSLTNAKSRLTDGAYIGLNATSVAMSGISQNVTDLLNISGFRMTVSCEVAPSAEFVA